MTEEILEFILLLLLWTLGILWSFGQERLTFLRQTPSFPGSKTFMRSERNFRLGCRWACRAGADLEALREAQRERYWFVEPADLVNGFSDGFYYGINREIIRLRHRRFREKRRLINAGLYGPASYEGM